MTFLKEMPEGKDVALIPQISNLGLGRAKQAYNIISSENS
jgi:hypothetical protein